LWTQLKPWVLGGAALVTAGTLTVAVVDIPGRTTAGSSSAAARHRGDYRPAGFPEAGKVHDMIGDLQSAVARGDARAVAAHVRFPFRLNVGSQAEMVTDEARFTASFESIFTPEIRAALAKCPRSALFANADGVMIGSGDLWIAPASSNNPEPRLAAVNVKVPAAAR
jgi:hypothetical protein